MTPTIPAANEALERRVLDAAAALAAEGRQVTQTAIRLRAHLGKATVAARVYSLRSRGLWPHGEPTKPGNYQPTPADFEAARAAACVGMGDGRGQVDDPREHGVLSVPRGGLDQGPPPDLAAAVRAIVREWKVRTGRIVPKARARATVPGNGLHGQAPAPYERTRHRHRSAWVSMDGKSRRIA